MAAPKPVKLGPGTLTIGATGTLVDMSCQIENANLAWSVDTDDDLNVLCGDTVPGARTYTAALSGTAVLDLTDSDGTVAFTWANKGQAEPFVFIPNTVAGATVTGTLVIDPLDVGGDEYGAVMTSDFEWACVGEPALDWPDSGVPPIGSTSDSTVGSTSDSSSSSDSGSSSGSDSITGSTSDSGSDSTSESISDSGSTSDSSSDSTVGAGV